MLLGCSNTRLENPASTKKLLDTIAGAEKDLKRCEGHTFPIQQKYSYGSGRRSRRELLGRFFCIKSLVIRRVEAEAEKDMTIRCGMVDDCYVEKFDVAYWHRRGVQKIVCPQATKCVAERTVRLHMTLLESSQFHVVRKENLVQLEVIHVSLVKKHNVGTTRQDLVLNRSA